MYINTTNHNMWYFSKEVKRPVILMLLFTFFSINKNFALYKHLLFNIFCCALVCLYHVKLVVPYKITRFVQYSILQPFGRNPYCQINSTERDNVYFLVSMAENEERDVIRCNKRRRRTI